MTDATKPLAEELETFEKHKDELLASAEGKYALVHQATVYGTYNDEQDAIAEGYKAFGNVPFLVKQILNVEVPANFVSSNIDL